MLVTGKETNMPVDLIYGTLKSRIYLNNYEIPWSMPISEPGNVWDMLLSDRRCIMTGTLHLIILRKEIGSFIGINQLLCKLFLVVGPVPS